MKAETQQLLDGLTFREGEITIGEHVLARAVADKNDVVALLQLVCSRVEGNEDGKRLRADQLYSLTGSELVAFFSARVLPGIKKQAEIGTAAIGKLSTEIH